jgi:hypothetical protein
MGRPLDLDSEERAAKRRDGIAVDAGRMTVGQYLDEWLTGSRPACDPPRRRATGN